MPCALAKHQSIRLASSCVLIFILSFTIRASATLGETDPPDTPENSTQGAVKRSHFSRTTSVYKVREIALPRGVIHEYVDNKGVVFAVSWNGPAHPDFTTLLGSYAGETARAHREHRKKFVARQAVSRVETKNIVYQRSGHMGDLSGLAYVPALVPPGVVEGELHD